MTPALFAQTKKDNGADWPMFNRDLAGTRYSPLTQINTANVAKLTKAWTYRFNREGKQIHGDSPSELYQEITPIVVNDVMYLPAGDRVVALEPETGKELWTYEVPGRARVLPRRGLLARRPQQSAAHHLHHRTQDDGAEREDRQGRSRLRQGRLGGADRALRRRAHHLQEHAADRDQFLRPRRAAHRPAAGSGRRPNPRAHGYDVRTGKELWTFHTFPKPGEIGHDTWGKNFEGNDSSQNRTGNNVWAFALTVDEEHGIVYEPVSGPGANYYGGDRPGANLFGNTTGRAGRGNRKDEVVFPERPA